ncbi:hypothetical protein NHQ30_000166 [Ciborinia camelliae]|nr:hypothetical protein NHQ30_000166 [Ciborinia camelliae]
MDPSFWRKVKVKTMDNSKPAVFGASSVPSTPMDVHSLCELISAKKAKAILAKEGPFVCFDSSDKTNDSGTGAKSTISKSFGSVDTVDYTSVTEEKKQDNSRTKPTTTQCLPAENSLAMNISKEVFSSKSVPSTPGAPSKMENLGTAARPAESNSFGSGKFTLSPSTSLFNGALSLNTSCSPLFGSATNATIGTPAATMFGQPSKSAPYRTAVMAIDTKSDIIDAPPQKRAKKAHNIVAQLPANEFTSKLGLFRSPEVLVTAGTSLLSKSYLLPKGLLIHASPYFETAIEVEKIGQFSQETIKLDCSSLAFDFVVQFLYTGSFVCPKFMAESGSQQISILIEFYELAEKLSLDVLEQILDNIKQLLIDDYRNLLAAHIRKAANFPTGHGLRMLFARSCIHAYLESVNPAHEQARKFSFKKELDELDGFAADLMRVYGEVAGKRTPVKFAESYDSLDGKKFYY